MVTVLGIGFFITIVSYFYRKIEYRNLSKEQKKRANIFNSPTAWALYSLSIAIVIGVIFMYSFINVMSRFSNVGKQQNTLIQQQQQNDTSQQ